MTVQEWWKFYGWEPRTGPMVNTLSPDRVPDHIRHAWEAGAKAEREACAALADEGVIDYKIAASIRARGDQ